MEAVGQVEAEVGVEDQEVVAVELEDITGSTLTPACRTCSRALNRSTWTRCMSGRLTWGDQDTGAAQDMGTGMGTGMGLTPIHTNILIPIPIHIHTHTRYHTGSHQPT